jgi:hypothetical protein
VAGHVRRPGVPTSGTLSCGSLTLDSRALRVGGALSPSHVSDIYVSDSVDSAPPSLGRETANGTTQHAWQHVGPAAFARPRPPLARPSASAAPWPSAPLSSSLPVPPRAPRPGARRSRPREEPQRAVPRPESKTLEDPRETQDARAQPHTCTHIRQPHRKRHFDTRRTWTAPRNPRRCAASRGMRAIGVHAAQRNTYSAHPCPHPVSGQINRSGEGSVVEEAEAREGHRHLVLVGCGDDLGVGDRAACRDNEGDATRRGHVDRVAEGEERIGGQ